MLLHSTIRSNRKEGHWPGWVLMSIPERHDTLMGLDPVTCITPLALAPPEVQGLSLWSSGFPKGNEGPYLSEEEVDAGEETCMPAMWSGEAS